MNFTSMDITKKIEELLKEKAERQAAKDAFSAACFSMALKPTDE